MSHGDHTLKVYKFVPSPESVAPWDPALVLYCEECEITTELPLSWRMPSSREILLKNGRAYDLEPKEFVSG